MDDAVIDAAIEAIKSEMIDNITAAAGDSSDGMNNGQLVLLYDYALPAMEDAIADNDGSGTVGPDALVDAAYDSHEAVEQAISETVEIMANSIIDLHAILQGAEIIDFLDFV